MLSQDQIIQMQNEQYEKWENDQLARKAEGLIVAVEVACNVLGIELTPERRSHLERLDADSLKDLLQHLMGTRAWPEDAE